MNKGGAMRYLNYLFIIFFVGVLTVFFFMWLNSQMVDKTQQAIEATETTFIFDKALDDFFETYGDRLYAASEEQVPSWLQTTFRKYGLYTQPNYVSFLIDIEQSIGVLGDTLGSYVDTARNNADLLLTEENLRNIHDTQEYTAAVQSIINSIEQCDIETQNCGQHIETALQTLDSIDAPQVDKTGMKDALTAIKDANAAFERSIADRDIRGIERFTEPCRYAYNWDCVQDISSSATFDPLKLSTQDYKRTQVLAGPNGRVFTFTILLRFVG